MSGKRRKGKSYTYIKSTTGPIIKFRFKIVVIIILIITALCFSAYMMGINLNEEQEGSFTATWQEHNAEEDSIVKTTENNNDSSEVKQIENPVPESNALTSTYFSKCVFVGDSITVGLSDYQLIPMKNVIAEVGMNIEKINDETMQTAFGEKTVLNALIEAEPENIYIMLGSNGIAWLSLDEMIEEYSEFINGIKSSLPHSKIYFLAIPPVTEERETAENPILNSTIDEYNSMLLELANKNGCYYIDLDSALKDDNGKFPKEYAADDGMHFNKSTYDIMLDYILSHVAK